MYGADDYGKGLGFQRLRTRFLENVVNGRRFGLPKKGSFRHHVGPSQPIFPLA